MSPPEANRAKGCDGKSGDVVPGKWPNYFRRGASKFVRETKQAVSNEIEMKMLPGQTLRAAQENENKENKDVEGDLRRNSRPARDTGAVGQGIPVRWTHDPETTTVK